MPAQLATIDDIRDMEARVMEKLAAIANELNSPAKQIEKDPYIGRDEIMKIMGWEKQTFYKYSPYIPYDFSKRIRFSKFLEWSNAHFND